MKPINRRGNPRIEIKLRCYVATPANRIHGAMRTENMSRNGLLIAWETETSTVPAPSLGEIVTVEIELPAHHSFNPKCIHCQGAVTRVSNENHGPTTVALSLNYVDFRPLQRPLFSSPALGRLPQPERA
ncbi:MAG: PilZ domain-containing protein [Bryobacteraceae bacterium]